MRNIYILHRTWFPPFTYNDTYIVPQRPCAKKKEEKSSPKEGPEKKTKGHDVAYDKLNSSHSELQTVGHDSRIDSDRLDRARNMFSIMYSILRSSLYNDRMKF